MCVQQEEGRVWYTGVGHRGSVGGCVSWGGGGADIQSSCVPDSRHRLSSSTYVKQV
jgi:hypothetical protein